MSKARRRNSTRRIHPHFPSPAHPSTVDDAQRVPSVLSHSSLMNAVANGNSHDDGARLDPSSSSSFRLFALDGRGSLVELSLPVPSSSPLVSDTTSSNNNTFRVLYEARGPGTSKGDWIVQQSAFGQLHEQHVLALARKDGRIDIVDAAEGRPIITLFNRDMKKGIHRWVGLAVAHDGIFACTSAGHFAFHPIARLPDDEGRTAHSHSAPIKRDLPEPLQQLVFTPASDPTHFAYGGEEIPLSVWDARQCISSDQTIGSDTASTRPLDDGSDRATAPNGETEKKRKRALDGRSKSRDLLWGEMWRAKNLPNDGLSLPQRAEIVSVAFVGNHTRLAVGTRTGIVRMFDTTQQRKHTHEHRVFAQEKSAVKTLTSSHFGAELIATDLTGRAFVLDARSGAILYQFKGIDGVVVAARSLPPMINRPALSYLVTASADRLVRLLTIPIDELFAKSITPRKTATTKGAVVSSQFFPHGITTLAWDGVIPTADAVERASAIAEKNSDEEDGEAGDGVWDGMPMVGGEKDDDDDDDDDDRLDSDHQRETRSKRRR